MRILISILMVKFAKHFSNCDHSEAFIMSLGCSWSSCWCSATGWHSTPGMFPVSQLLWQPDTMQGSKF